MRTRKLFLATILAAPLAAGLSIAWAADAPAGLPRTTPWDLKALFEPPSFSWVDDVSPVKSLTYVGENYRGRATKVFAYLATPGSLAKDLSNDQKLPAVVLVHGGGGTAFKEWAELWAKRGYAAIAMDLGGKNVGDAGGPDQGHDEKFRTMDKPVTESWCYHAVANVIRGHSLLRRLPGVDAERTAITGISWGGYLTCIVASLDDRFRAAVPVYGCGFLHHNSCWLEPDLKKLSAEHRDRWVELYDPSQYLPSCRVPILFVNGTNDFAYPLDSYMKSYRAVKGPKNLRVTVNLPHGHPEGWAPAEISLFVDQHLRDARPLLRLGEPKLEDQTAGFGFDPKTPPKSASLHFTSHTNAINERKWTTQPAAIANGKATAGLPVGATAWFFTAEDDRGAVVSTEVVIER